MAQLNTVRCVSGGSYFCLCFNLSVTHEFVQTLCKQLHFLLVLSYFLLHTSWDVLKLTFQSPDTLLLRRLSRAWEPRDKGLHLDAVQSVGLQPAEYQSVVGDTLGPLEQGIANNG